MKLLPIFFATFALIGCTYSVNMIHTEGTATDIVDENQTATPDISPTISIPASAI